MSIATDIEMKIKINSCQIPASGTPLICTASNYFH